jgi:hypothetical protein
MVAQELPAGPGRKMEVWLGSMFVFYPHGSFLLSSPQKFRNGGDNISVKLGPFDLF